MAMLSHRHSSSHSLALSLLPFVFFVLSANGPPGATYRRNVSEVRVAFFATDAQNHPLDMIHADDFAVVDGGVVIRNFRSLVRSDETKLDTVILVDSSESVASQLGVTMNHIRQLVSSEENLSVVSFSGLQPVMICARNCRSVAASNQLLALQPAGATPMFDALSFSANFIAGHRIAGARPVLVLFSDGNDNISKHSGADALDAVVASGALIYAVDLNKSETRSGGTMLLQRIAEATGGRYFSAAEGTGHLLETALEDLHSSYVVSYQLPNRTVGFHSLRILPKHNLDLRFHCRSGYYYSASNS